MERAYTLGLYEKAMPSDLTWREKLLTAKEAGFDFAYQYPGMNKVLQAAGRVIRTTEDEGTGTADAGNRRADPDNVLERSSEISAWQQ